MFRVNNNYITIFSGNYTKEVIHISEQWETLPVGAIMRTLFETDNSIYNSMFNIATRLGDLFYKAKHEWYKPPEYLPASYYEEYINILLEIDNLNIPDFMKKLFKLLPIQYNLINSEQMYLYGEYYRRAASSFPPVFQPYHPERNADLYQLGRPLEDFISPTSYADSVSIYWEYFLFDVLRAPNDPKRELTSATMPEVLRILELHSKSLYILVEEALMIKGVLEKTLIGANNVSTIRYETMACVPEVFFSSPAPFDSYTTNYIKHTCDHKISIDSFYTATNLTRLIMLELDLVEKHNLFIKKCSCCQKPYITYNAQSKYCRFPNSDFNGKTCQEEAPRLHNRDRKTLSSERNKNRDAYKKWSDPIIKQERKYLDDLFEYIIKDDNYGKTVADRKKFYRSMIQQVERRYKRWCKKSKTAIEKFNHNKLTKSKCKAKISYPSERARGPKLYDALHAMQGILTDE